MMMERGKFITFEGIDGCGKSTQLNHLFSWLSSPERHRRLSLSNTKQPGFGPLGAKIRELLLQEDGDPIQISSLAELFLYAADRTHHCEWIEGELSAGRWVLCDRYIDSTVAYQGFGRMLDFGVIDQVNHIATGGLEPDLTIYLNVPLGDCLARLDSQSDSRDRIESEAITFFQRVQQGYDRLAFTKDRIVTVSGVGSELEVSERVIQVVRDKFDF